MQHKFIIIILLAVSLSACGIFEADQSDEALVDPTTPAARLITVTGTVIENEIGVPADGNNVLTIELDNGETRTVLYMEGGLVPAEVAEHQCNNNDDVNQFAMTLSVGDVVTVSGIPSDAYDIDVCSNEAFSITLARDTDAVLPLSIEGGTPAPIDPIVIDPPSEVGHGNLESLLDADGNVITRSLSGEVVEFISDCAFDGICAYVVETESGEQVTVIWSEGMSPNCQNDMFNGGDTDIQVGDTLEATGRAIDDSTISACGNDSYSITKTS
ncbi:MAG: hypothetical protein AAFR81_29110 [Chloroflexota bacterium]